MATTQALNSERVLMKGLVPTSVKADVRTQTTAITLSADDTGAVLVLNSATEFAVTLPAVKRGLRFTFIVGAAPSGASYTVAAGSAIIHGHVLAKDLDAVSDSGSTAGTPVGTITFVDAKSVVGDRAELVCDGTNWFAVCMTGGTFDAITLS